MNSSRKRTLFTAVLSMVTVASFVGSLSGSLAWYAYSTRATVSYQGTAVSQAEQLQIGLISDVDFRGSLTGITKETIDGTDYYWAKAGVGFKSAAIQAYLEKQGYATNSLEPVTSREYDSGDDLSLFQSPIKGRTSTFVEAKKSQYCYLHFAFRIIGRDGMGNDVYRQGQSIWLTKATAAAAGANQDIYKALRLHVDGESKFVLNPSSLSDTKGSTKVAGVLNLDTDEYYDYNAYGELIYGDYDGTPTKTYNATASANPVDINGVGDTTPSTFVAKHAADTDCYTDLSDLNPKLAQYETLKTIAPEDDGAGHLSAGTPICVTANDENAIATADMTIYLEGWDHSVVDKEINHGFNLGLTFQINRV